MLDVPVLLHVVMCFPRVSIHASVRGCVCLMCICVYACDACYLVCVCQNFMASANSQPHMSQIPANVRTRSAQTPHVYSNTTSKQHDNTTTANNKLQHHHRGGLCTSNGRHLLFCDFFRTKTEADVYCVSMFMCMCM